VTQSPLHAGCAEKNGFLRGALALLLVLALLPAGCVGDKTASISAPDALPLSGQGIILAGGYDQIYAAIESRLSAAAKGTYRAPATAAAKQPMADEGEKADGASDAAPDAASDVAPGAATDAATDATPGAAQGATPDATPAAPRQDVVGLGTGSKTVSSTDGYRYKVAGEELEVSLDGKQAEVLTTLNLYDYANVGGDAVCLIQAQDTLAVLFASDAGYNYNSVDYALSAYGAPRSMLLFFDISEPEDPRFVKALGISGTPRAVVMRADSLCVVSAHNVAPLVGSDGLWMTRGAGASSEREIREALELRKDSPVAFVPSYYVQDTLVPLRPAQIYLSEYGNYTTATVFAAFSLVERENTALFALYDLADDTGETRYSVAEDAVRVSYTVTYQDAPAVATVVVPLDTANLMPGIGAVSWSDPTK
jgi:hypothetical protein